MIGISAINNCLQRLAPAQDRPASQPAASQADPAPQENLSPTDRILYLIGQAAEKSLGKEYVSGIMGQILALADDNPDKARLLIIFCQTFFPLKLITSLETEELLLKAAELMPQDTKILLEVYRFYIGGQEYDKAGPYLDRVIKLSDDPALKLELANYYVLKNDLDSALKITEQLQEKEPDNIAYQLLEADLLQKQAEKQLQENQPGKAYKTILSAINLYEKAAKDNPNPGLKLRLAELNLVYLQANQRMIQQEQRLSLAKTSIEFYEKNIDFCLRRIDFLLQELETAAASEPLLYSEISHLYLALGKIEPAKKLMQKAAELYPDNLQLKLELADLLVLTGDLKQGLAIYDELLSDENNPAILAQVYSRVSLLKTQLGFLLVQKKFSQPNGLQTTLNFLILAAFTLINPYLAMANVLGMALNKTFSKELNEKELAEILATAGSLEKKAIGSIKQQGPEALLFIGLEQGKKASALQEQVKQMSRQTLASEEELAAYQTIVEQEKQKALDLLNQVLSDEYIKQQPVGFETAKHYLSLYLLIEKLLDEQELAPEEENILEQKSRLALEKGKQTLENMIEIAAEKKDMDTLFELAKAARFFGQISIDSLAAAYSIAKNDPASLLQFADFASQLWRQHQDDPELSLAFKTFALSAYQEMLNQTQDVNARLFCLRQMFILGEHEKAYLGYVGLINDFKTSQPDKLPGLFYELGLMALVRGKKEKALEWFTRSKLFSQQDIDLLLLENDPAFPISGLSSFKAYQVRAICLLYTAWSEGEISASLFSLAAADLFASASKKAHALTSFDGQTVEMQVEEQAIDVIEIRGNNNTKAAVIIRELEFSGIKPGMAYSADLDDLFNRANEASKRLKCFSIKAIYYEQDHGVNTLVVEVDEQSIMSAPVGASYGSQATSLLAGFNHNNLFGGGEKLAVELKFNWFHAEGFKHFNSYGGNFSYQEPYLFLIGSDHPVSGKINLEYGQRPNYDTNKFETVIGGSVGLGIRLARNTTLIVAPSLYSVGSHYELGLGTGIEYDNRDNIFLPNKGVYFSSMLTPGAAINSSQDNPYYIKLDNDLRGYVPLPLGMVLAMRGVFGIGYNLAGGNKYFMGGNFLNPYVRSAGSSMAAGSLVLAASLELRSPVINAEYAKLQPYIYCDAGSVFSSTLYSCGLGLRVLAPVIGLFNLGVGLPGGFFLWLGPMGWN